MWRTSGGDRKLVGAEATLFKEGALCFVDDVLEWTEEGSHCGVAAFDSLDKERRALIIISIVEAVLGSGSPPTLYAWNEGAIYSIFESIKDFVRCELEGEEQAPPEDPPFWRKLIQRAYLEMTKEDQEVEGEEDIEQKEDSDDLEMWDDKVERLKNQILHDDDFIFCETLMDTPQPEAHVIKEAMGIEDGYAITPAPLFGPEEKKRLMTLRREWNKVSA